MKLRVTTLDKIVFKFVLLSMMLIPIIFFMGCAKGGINLGAPPIPPNLCEEFAAYKADSLLLKVQATYNVPINEVYYGLIDTSRLLVLSDVVDKEWFKQYLGKVGTFYKERYPNLTHDQLITYMVSEKIWGDKVEMVLSILSTRIGYFRSNLLINQYDNCMYANGWSNAKKLLFIQ